MAMPKYSPSQHDRMQVKMMTGMGLTQEDICNLMGITAPTLRKYFRQEIDTGTAEANAKVAQSLFRQATNPEKPNVVAAIFWLKSRAGWRDHDDQSDKPGKKENKQEAAKVASRGRFSAPASPKIDLHRLN